MRNYERVVVSAITMSRQGLIVFILVMVIVLPGTAAVLLIVDVQSQVADVFRLNAKLQRAGYYTDDSEFKTLGLFCYLHEGYYLTAFQRLNRLHHQLETHDGLVKIPDFKSSEDEYNFYLNLQNPRTGAFIDDSYPYCTYNAATLNVLVRLETLARQTDQPLHLKYRLKYLDEIDTPDKLVDFLNGVSHVGWPASKFSRTTFLFARNLASFATPEDNVIERNGLYHFSAAWRHALLEWFYDTQDPDTGFWGAQSPGGKLLRLDISNTASIVKAFVDTDGDDIHSGFPLHYRDRLFETTLEQLSLPGPEGEDSAQIHEWNLKMSRGIVMLTRYLWNSASKNARMTARGLIKRYVRMSFQEFYVGSEGAFSDYPDFPHASVDGTGRKLHDLEVVGFFSTQRQRDLWGETNVVDLGTFKATTLSGNELDPLRDRRDVNSVRLYTARPKDDYLDGVAAVFYPGGATVLDALDIASRTQQWLQTTPHLMQDRIAKSEVQQRLKSFNLTWVPVYARKIPLDKANELLGKNGRIVAIGFDILQVPTYEATFEERGGE